MIRILLLLLMFAPTFSQIGSNNVYNLKECISIAKVNNGDIIVQNARIRSAGADLTSAFGNYLPSLRYNYNYQRDLNPEPRPAFIGGQIIPNATVEPNSFFMSVNAQMTIFDGFSREANYRLAEETLGAEQLASNQLDQDVTINVISNYINVIRNEQILNIRRENFEVGKTELERIQAQYEAGVVPIANVYAQEADLGQREIEIVNAENDLARAKADLLIVMGKSPIEKADFDGSDIPTEILENEILDFRKKIGGFESAVKSAITNRPDYQASYKNISAAKESIQIANSAYIPNLSLSGGWSWSNTEFNRFADLGRSFIGLNLSVPIFQNFSVNSSVQRSKLQYKQAEIQQFNLEQNIKNQVQNSLLGLEAAERLLEVTKRNEKSAQQNYNAISERVKVGAANIAELTFANGQLVTAKINRIDAVYNYILSQKQLLYSIGLIN